MTDKRNALPGDDDELSAEELEQAAGGAAELADNTNCGTGNCNCGTGPAPTEPIWV